MAGIEDEQDDYSGDYPVQEESIIPGDNDKQGPPHEIPYPANPDAPENLTRIDAVGGDIPINPPVSG